MKPRIKYLRYEQFINEDRNTDAFNYTEEVSKRTGEITSVVASEKYGNEVGDDVNRFFNIDLYDRIDKLVMQHEDTVKKKKELEQQELLLRDEILSIAKEELFDDVDLLITKQIQTQNILLTISKYSPGSPAFTRKVKELDVELFISSVKKLCNSTFEAYDLVDRIIETSTKIATVEKDVEVPAGRDTAMRLSNTRISNNINWPRNKHSLKQAEDFQQEETISESDFSLYSLLKTLQSKLKMYTSKLTRIFSNYDAAYSEVTRLMKNF